MAISQYTAVFSLLGTTYGGNGQTTFGLPDLRGRAPIHSGQGPGLSNYAHGQSGGAEKVTLMTAQIPAHNHTLSVNNGNGNLHNPIANSSIAATVDVNGDNAQGFSASAPNTVLNASSISGGGNNLPHDNLPPYLVLSYIICLEGIYPSRN